MGAVKVTFPQVKAHAPTIQPNVRPLRSSALHLQVTDVDDSSGVINVRLSEMVVGNLNLRFVDRKTSEVREEGATRPEVVLRQLSTRPGQVSHAPCICGRVLACGVPRAF